MLIVVDNSGFVFLYQCAVKRKLTLLFCVWLINLVLLRQFTVHSHIVSSPFGAHRHTPTNTHTQRSQRWGSEVSGVLVMDKRTMGGESLLLKTALPFPLQLSSALGTQSGWRQRDVRRQPSAPGRSC